MNLPKLTLRTMTIAFAFLVAGCGDSNTPSEESQSEVNGQSPSSNTAPPTPAGAAGWIGPEWEARWNEQLAVADDLPVEADFLFRDRQPESRIEFTHTVVEDAGKQYKAAHYDHGNGVSAADVDGDGFVDLYFCNQIGSNQLWRNRGDGTFENITALAGVGAADRVSVGASFADIDNDGDPDLFVTIVRESNLLFENLGGGQFRDITEKAGLGYKGHSSGAVFFDFDRDGLLDLFVSNVGRYTTDAVGPGDYYIAHKDAFSGHLHPDRAEPSLLYRNMGDNTFTEVSKELGLVDMGWSGDATVCDVNEDGWPDLYVLNMQGDDHYYENEDGKRFVEKTSEFFPKTPWGAMGVKFFDFNLDGGLDLFLTDMHSDMTGEQTKLSKKDVSAGFEKKKSEAWCRTEFSEAYLQGATNNLFGNGFYIKRGPEQFEEASDALGVETFWPWGFSVGDVNADGYPDIFVTAGMGFGFRYGINSLLLNVNGERFQDAEFLVGIEPRLNARTMKTAFVLDAEGADKDHPLSRGQTGMVPVYEHLSSRSSVIVDIDNDGDLDIVTNEMNDRPQILESDLSEKATVRFLQIKLDGKSSNRDGIGATVTVTAQGKRHTQFVDGKSGYFGQSSLPLYFGLGSAEIVESVEVKWPNGKTQQWTGPLDVNRTLTISEQG